MCIGRPCPPWPNDWRRSSAWHSVRICRAMATSRSGWAMVSRIPLHHRAEVATQGSSPRAFSLPISPAEARQPVVPGLFHCRFFFPFHLFRSACAAPRASTHRGPPFLNSLLQAATLHRSHGWPAHRKQRGRRATHPQASLHFGCAFAFTAGPGRMRGPAGCAGIDHPVQRRACAVSSELWSREDTTEMEMRSGRSAWYFVVRFLRV